MLKNRDIKNDILKSFKQVLLNGVLPARKNRSNNQFFLAENLRRKSDTEK